METKMKNWTMNFPVPVEFGAGCVVKLGQYAAVYKKALVVTGRRAMKESGVTDRICGLLKAAGTTAEVYDRILPDPNYEEIEEAAALAKRFGAQAVVGLGGGSVMDAAKAVAVAATHPGPIMDYRGGGARTITSATLPILAVSATSGTGSHVGRVAVLSDRKQKIKRAFFSDCMYPEAAFCDAEILRTMPPEVTASTGFDAFAHALEGFLSTSDNPMGKLCAREAMRIIFQTLPQVLARGDDLNLRDRMAWADTLAGISLATNTVVIPHVIGMVLGGRYGISHGRSIACVLGSCLRHSRPAAAGKLAEVARVLGCEDHLDEAALADRAIALIEEFLNRIGMAQSPKEYGVPEGDFQSIAQEVIAVFSARVQSDPVPTDADGLVKILKRSK